MPSYGDKLTEGAARRIQREEDFKRSQQRQVWKDPIVPRNPNWKHRPLKHPITGRCAVVLDNGAGYCGAPNGANAFRFCPFHADMYLNKTVRTR